MPVTRLKPVMNNPYPQFTNVAVAPFTNGTDNRNIDGAEVARCYGEELQKIPGFNVLPVRIVEIKMAEAGLSKLENIEDARILCKVLGVDAIVIGRVNNYDGYYPQKFGLTVEMYSANRYYHPIPNGHGLPWGTKSEEDIPLKIVTEAERDLARAQLETQTPIDTETEIAYRQFMEKRRLELQRRQQIQEFGGIVPITPDMYDETDDSYASEDDEDYESPEIQAYKKMQQYSVDQQMGYAFGGPVTIPKSTHNVRLNSRNYESVRQKLAELYEEEFDEDYSKPLPSPLPYGLEPSDVTDRIHVDEMLQNEMHRVNKPEITAAIEADNGIADQSPAIAFGRHHNENRDNQGQNTGLVSQFPNNCPQPYGFMIQGPINPNTGYPDSGGVFVAFGGDGNIAAAFQIDPATGRLGQEVPLSALGLQPSSLQMSVPTAPNYHAVMPGMMQPNGQIALEPSQFPGLPPNWPDSRGLIPDGPKEERPQPKIASDAPIISLTKLYSANDSEFTQALQDYEMLFQDDKRIGGWKMTIDDRVAFISFCCRMHIWEMFGSRGGAGKAIEVRRTWKTWYGGHRPY